MKKREKKQKFNQNRKPLSNTGKIALVFAVAFLIYLAVALPIHYQYAAFSWHWFTFGLIVIIIPYAFINFQVMWQKKISLSEAQKKNASTVTIKYIIYFWFLDCFYMAIFNQWTVWIYIIGIITLVKVFYSLTVVFLGKKQKNVFMNIGLLFDFLLGVGLTIYLIYLIPDKFTNLQTIITSIIAAIFGGVFTLVGVAWTIRKGDEDRKADRKKLEEDRKEEERKKYRPFMELQEEIPARMVRVSKLRGINCNDPKYEKDGEVHIFSTRIKEFNIKNISESNIILEGVVVDNEYCAFDHLEIVAKGEAIQIQTTRNVMLSLDSTNVRMALIVSDILGNKYKLNCILERLSENAGMIVVERTNSKANYYSQSFYIATLTLPILMEETTNE